MRYRLNRRKAIDLVDEPSPQTAPEDRLLLDRLVRSCAKSFLIIGVTLYQPMRLNLGMSIAEFEYVEILESCSIPEARGYPPTLLAR